MNDHDGGMAAAEQDDAEDPLARADLSLTMPFATRPLTDSARISASVPSVLLAQREARCHEPMGLVVPSAGSPTSPGPVHPRTGASEGHQ
jgi:hypothetical protein